MLVIRRGPAARRPGYWTPPTGALEAGETQEQAVTRESREETGLRVRPVQQVWECDTDDHSFRLHWWTADLVESDRLELDPGEASEALWVDTDDFLRLEPTFEQHREFFLHVLPTLA